MCAFCKPQSPYTPWLPQNHSDGEPQAQKEGTCLRGLEMKRQNHRAGCFRCSPSDTILCIHFSICPYLTLNNNILLQHLHQEGLNLTRWLPLSVIKIRGCCFRRPEPVQSWLLRTESVIKTSIKMVTYNKWFELIKNQPNKEYPHNLLWFMIPRATN